MKRGGKVLTSAAVLAVAACGGSSGKLEIRSTPTTLAPGDRPVPFRIAEARGQLALGNVALALEGFRKAWRDDPNSIDALAGMAACYDRMGRYDLSRRNYEAALALAPANTGLLGAFAASLEQQGLRDEATKVRREIALRSAAAAEPPIAGPAQPGAEAPAPAAPVQVALPVVAQPPPAPEPVRVADRTAPAPAAKPVALDGVNAPPAQPAFRPMPVSPEPAPVKAAALPERPQATTEAPMTAQAAVARPVELVDAVPAPPPAPVVKPQQASPATGRSVTVTLPPPRPVASAAPERAAEAAVPPTLHPAANPASARTAAVGARPPATRSGPRLERLSLGEIALVSGSGPLWRSTVVARTERSTTVRFVPMRRASMQPLKVRLLNAARVNRLAARTRSWLEARGWRGLGIGNAEAIRSRSLIVYPRHQRALAQNLSNQFGFAMEERSNVKFVTMLLGRDAARIEELQPESA